MRSRFLILFFLLPSVAFFAWPSASKPEAKPYRFGKDLAVFFATDTYTYKSSWPQLYAPVKDAGKIAADLYDLYGFDTMIIVNPTKELIRSKLKNLAARNYYDDSQLLVYFSGHGKFLDDLGQGFYIPKEGKPSARDQHGDSWMSFGEIRTTVSNINCRHILLAMDACFSGSIIDSRKGRMDEIEDIDRPGEGDYKRNQRIQDMLRAQTRIILTSGRKDYVPDPSEFAAQFKAGLKSLGGKDGLLDVYSLYHTYLKKASSNPIMSSFEKDESGSNFIFDYKSRYSRQAPPEQPGDEMEYWENKKRENTISGYQDYQRQYPNGQYSSEAERAIKNLRKKSQQSGARDPNPVARPNMVFITSGTYTMGDVFTEDLAQDEAPHKVSVNAFYCAEAEVTFNEYDSYCDATGADYPSDEGWGRESRPVINVNWYDAVRYCNWLSDQHNYRRSYIISGDQVTLNWSANGYRLPTEAEWEYAARNGGQKLRFGNGKDMADPLEINFDNHEEHGYRYVLPGVYSGKTVPVKSYKPSQLNLYDMAGNVWEWCWDWYGPYAVSQTPLANPQGPSIGNARVLRGGCWYSQGQFIRTAYRGSSDPNHANYYRGFRLVRTAIVGK